uniref:SFRICE_017017 n=1 Tax=Spodoptera frugiperda TaxID=7108 RepID=A0A2H1X1L4_SPOFR
MSTSKGSNVRKRPQKHQNRTAFKNDLHDTSRKTKFLNSLEITGVCKRCKDILEWKIKYKKYKPLTAPRKCVGCEQKTIKHAYHMLCTKCALEKTLCAKCCKPVENQDSATIEETQNVDLKAMLKDLPERKRRTIMRLINKQEEGQQLTPEIKAQIDDMLLKMDSIALDDDDFNFSDDDDDGEFNSDSEPETK